MSGGMITGYSRGYNQWHEPPTFKPYKHFGWHTDKIFCSIWHPVLLGLRKQ